MGQKSPNIWVTFARKVFTQKLTKIAKSGHTAHDAFSCNEFAKDLDLWGHRRFPLELVMLGLTIVATTRVKIRFELLYCRVVVLAQLVEW